MTADEFFQWRNFWDAMGSIVIGIFLLSLSALALAGAYRLLVGW